MTDGDPVAGEGLDAGRLETIQREDGSSQITDNGKPIYHLSNDQTPADTLGQDQVDKWFVVSPDGSPIRTIAAVDATENGNFGTILTDTSGHSLYIFANDECNVTNCNGPCALAWTLLLTVEDPVAGEGLAEDRIGVISRGNGANQVTYNGKPLYYFAAYEKPGDTMGQDLFSVWFVVSTDDGAVYTKAPVNATENGDLGTILTDASDRSLYQFANDERNVPNCNALCSLAWPPLISVEDPVAGEGVNEDRIGTTTRENGSKQVIFYGSPLYYFAADEKPGDAIGQDLGEVWFVINNSEPLPIILVEQSDSGQHGTAVLSGRGTFTNVSLSLSAGSLETELVHIHEGR